MIFEQRADCGGQLVIQLIGRDLDQDLGHIQRCLNPFLENGDFQLWEPGDSGSDPNNLFRNSRARYFLPSADEWYKAAFYDPVTDIWYDYPNGSNEPPIPVASGTVPGKAVWNQSTGPADVVLTGGLSPFGMVGQAGNV